MFSSITFFGSLGGLALLFGLKVWEMKSGAKLFSVLRYKTDIYLRQKASLLVWNTKRMNLASAIALLFIFLRTLLRFAQEIFSPIIERIQRTDLYRMVEGKYEEHAGNGGGEKKSEFMKEMSSIKNGNGNAAHGPSSQKDEKGTT